MEAGGIADRRKTLLGGLTGQVIDIGVGTGPSFGHYLASITRVLARAGRHRMAAPVRRCHLGRDTAAAIERAGFTARLDRFLFPGTRTAISFRIAGQATSCGQ